MQEVDHSSATRGDSAKTGQSIRAHIEAALRSAGYIVSLREDFTFDVPVGTRVSALDAALDMDGVRVVRNGNTCSIAIEVWHILAWREQPDRLLSDDTSSEAPPRALITIG
jgi:hypothetical protein